MPNATTCAAPANGCVCLKPATHMNVRWTHRTLHTCDQHFYEAGHELEQARGELARLERYQAREPRRFGRVGTWDESVDNARLAVTRLAA